MAISYKNNRKVHEKRDPLLIRNPWLGIILVMILYMIFGVIPPLVVALLVEGEFLISNPYILRVIEFVSLGVLLLVFIPFVFRLPKNNKKYSDYMRDIQASGTTLKSILVGLLTLLVVFILMYGSVYLSAVLSKFYLVTWQGQSIPQAPGVITDFSSLLDPNAFLNVYYALTPGIMEELAFRGIILILLLRKYKWKKAIVIDGVLFGLFHLFNLLGPTINYFAGYWTIDQYITIIRSVGFQVIYAASLGISWAYFAVKSRSLLPCIISHYVIDAFGGLVLTPNIGPPDFGVLWIYFICITLLGIGILPAILNMIITKSFYKDPPLNPWEFKTEVKIIH